jgi:hypothetical protein
MAELLEALLDIVAGPYPHVERPTIMDVYGPQASGHVNHRRATAINVPGHVVPCFLRSIRVIFSDCPLTG